MDKDTLRRLKSRYQKGMRVKCLHMNDPQAMPSGTLGTVDMVDDMGTIHVNWDNGSTLGLIVGEDDWTLA